MMTIASIANNEKHVKLEPVLNETSCNNQNFSLKPDGLRGDVTPEAGMTVDINPGEMRRS